MSPEAALAKTSAQTSVGNAKPSFEREDQAAPKPQGRATPWPSMASALPVEARAAIARWMPAGHGIGAIRLLQRPLLSVDASLKFLVLDQHGDPIFLADWSADVAPQSTLQASQRAQAFGDAVGPALARWIVTPNLLGTYHGRSCTIAPAMQELGSRNPSRVLQRREKPWRVMRWLGRVTKQTARVATETERLALFDSPLRLMAQHPGVGKPAREMARQALRDLRLGRWQPVVQAAHYDLRVPNVMAQSKAVFSEPRLIDWGSAALQGHGFFDTVCVAESFRLPLPWVRWAVRRNAAASGQNVQHVAAQCMAALGHLHMTQPQWSDVIFESMSRQMADYLGRLALVPAPTPSEASSATGTASGWHGTAVNASSFGDA
jgi:hypothetical protein